jgi:hypothetical protein
MGKVKGGLAGILGKWDEPARLLVAADYARDAGGADADQLEAAGRLLIGSAGERALAQFKAVPGVGRLWKDNGRYAAIAITEGWVTDGRMASRGVPDRELATAGRIVDATGARAPVVKVADVLRPAAGGERLQFFGLEGNERGNGDAFFNVGPEGEARGRLSAWRVLWLWKRHSGASWRWYGKNNAAQLVEGGRVVAAMMPMT